jgi:hypothetical protein
MTKNTAYSSDSIAQLQQCLYCVDMSSSGVTYSTNVIVSGFWSRMQESVQTHGKEYTDWNRVAEACADAIQHCRNRQFKVLPDNAFHQKNRIEHRIAKLLDRGWTRIEDVIDTVDVRLALNNPRAITRTIRV